MDNILAVNEIIVDDVGTAIETSGGILCRVVLQNGQESIASVSADKLAGLGIQVLYQETEAPQNDSNPTSCNSNATVPDSNVSQNKDFWSDESTKLLLDEYEEYLPEVGPMKKFKNKKTIWEMISQDIRSNAKSAAQSDKSSVQCENRYKTVMKRKRSIQANNSTSGSSRKKIQFEEEIRRIAGIDNIIEPEVMQSAEECTVNIKDYKDRTKKTKPLKETVHLT